MLSVTKSTMKTVTVLYLGVEVDGEEIVLMENKEAQS